MTNTALRSQAGGPRSTAEEQRTRIIAHALAGFSRAGYHATPVAEIAAAAQVSPAYVFRLFPGKLGLFIATIDYCYDRVATALLAGAEISASSTPHDILEAMSQAYVDLIRDRDLIMLQVHAQSACEVPEIRDAVHRGIATIVREVSRVSGADPLAVQRFIAYGQLCHLIVQAGLVDVKANWAELITAGMSHPA